MSAPLTPAAASSATGTASKRAASAAGGGTGAATGKAAGVAPGGTASKTVPGGRAATAAGEGTPPEPKQVTDPGVAGTIGGSGGLTFEATEATGETVRLKVYRGSGVGIYKEYEIPKTPGMVVLDCIHEIQREQEQDLACRWNCKAGKCGSCSAEINGKPKLMCMTRLEDLAAEPGGDKPIRVAPLKAFGHVKDLVTDVSWNYEQNKRVVPFTPRKKTPEEEAKGEFNMKQMDVDRIQEFRKCIECFLCQDTCHVLRSHEAHDEFAGPRFMIRYAGLDMHPADEADRLDALWDKGGIGMCNITKCCTEVCPEHITITDNAIIPMKERVASRKFDPIAIVWRKLRGK